MPLFQFTPPTRNMHQERAIGLLQYGDQVADQIRNFFISSKERMWGVEGFTVADAQKVLVEMDKFQPGLAATAFAKLAALGEFINAVTPGSLSEEELGSPVPYVVDSAGGFPRIVLTGDRYPTEPIPEEEEQPQG